MSRTGRMLWVVLLSTPIFPGCRHADGRCPISGKVTFRGAPLTIGTIQFLTDAGPAAGALIRDGAFDIPAAQGLMPGKYRVWISATEPLPEWKEPGASSPPTRELIPPEFHAKTTQTIDVTAHGSNAFSFDIPNAAP